MREYIIILICCCSFYINFAQTPQRQVIRLLQAEQLLDVQKQPQRITSEVLELPLQEVTPFLAYALVVSNLPLSAPQPEVWIRFSENTKDWSNWTLLPSDEHPEETAHTWASALQFERATAKYYQYQMSAASNHVESTYQLHFYSPGKSLDNNNITEQQVEPRTCPCPKPTFKERKTWCPNNNCPPNLNPSSHQVSHLIVHHSAGTNIANDWAAVVRAIWDFHVNSRGWSDVGYNWLIDPNGIMYEGRGENIVGAHFCGTNTGAEGVCMLGDFTSITPKAAAFDALTQLLAWKSCDRSIYPIDRSFHAASGLNLLEVSGHRDGCSTSCPGDAFYPLLDSLRFLVIEYIDNTCNTNILPAPYNLTYEWDGLQNVKLNWNYDLVSSNIRFSVERSTGEDYRYQVLKELPSSQAIYTDKNIVANELYFYRIRAISSATASAYTNKIIINTQLSANSTVEATAVKIYPNPANDYLTIQFETVFSGVVEYQLTDILGRTIQRGKLAATTTAQTINLQNAHSGWYHLLLTDGSQEWVGKLLIHQP